MQDLEFNFSICLYSTEIHLIKRDHQPSVQQSHFHRLCHIDYSSLHVKHKNQVYVLLIRIKFKFTNELAL